MVDDVGVAPLALLKEDDVMVQFDSRKLAAAASASSNAISSNLDDDSFRRNAATHYRGFGWS